MPSNTRSALLMSALALAVVLFAAPPAHAGKAETGGHPDPAPFPFDAQPLDGPPQALGEHARRGGIGTGQQHQEFLAAIAADDIARAQLPAQGLRHGPQAMVAAGMAMGIVDRLEPIEIDEQDR